MDAVLCSMPTGTQESQSSPSRSLRVRLGVVTDIGNPNQHREHLMPLGMRGINFDMSTSSDSTLGTRAVRMVRYVLVQGCIVDALTQTTNGLEVWLLVPDHQLELTQLLLGIASTTF